VSRQAELLHLARSTLYYVPKPVSESDLELMRRIDEIHLEHPFAGSRMIRDLLRNDGWSVGRRRIRRLMKKMGIEAIYRRSNSSRRNQAHRTYPYLLRSLKIRPNQVWAILRYARPAGAAFTALTLHEHDWNAFPEAAKFAVEVSVI
jgi:putative transposase